MSREPASSLKPACQPLDELSTAGAGFTANVDHFVAVGAGGQCPLTTLNGRSYWITTAAAAVFTPPNGKAPRPAAEDRWRANTSTQGRVKPQRNAAAKGRKSSRQIKECPTGHAGLSFDPGVTITMPPMTS